MYRNLHASVLDFNHMHQKFKASVNEAKVTVRSALKTPEAHYWVEALNTEIKQHIGALRAVKLFEVPAGAFASPISTRHDDLKRKIAALYSLTNVLHHYRYC